MSQKSKAKILIMSTDNETASKMWDFEFKRDVEEGLF